MLRTFNPFNIKQMKAKMLITSTLVLFSFHLFADPIVTRTKDKWWRSGFDIIITNEIWDMNGDGSSTLVALHINCSGAGDMSCPKSESFRDRDYSQDHDLTDPELDLVDTLISHAEDEQSNGNLNDTYSQTIAIQREGEPTKYYTYTVVWSVDDNDKSTITVDRQLLN